MERKKDRKSLEKLPDIEDLVQPIVKCSSSDLTRLRWKHYNTVIRVTCIHCGSCTTTNCMKTIVDLGYCPSCDEPLLGSQCLVIRRALNKVINCFPYKSANEISEKDRNDIAHQHPPVLPKNLSIEGGCATECKIVYFQEEDCWYPSHLTTIDGLQRLREARKNI